MTARAGFDPPALDRWCRDHLGSPPGQIIFQRGYLSQVTGLRLINGVQAVVKVRIWQDRLAACGQVQQALQADGFPAPRLLVPPARFGGLGVSAEELIVGGEMLPPHADSAQRFAEALCQLVRRAPRASSLSTLEPSLPWVAWDRAEARLWPDPDDRADDLNAHAGARWLDDIASAARGVLLGLRVPAVVGHGDWYSQNVSWVGRSLHAVHDWDSLVAQPEAAVAGAAAAIWPGTGLPGEVATVRQSEDFLDAYQRAAGRSFSAAEVRAAWAAGLWTRAFDAKKASVEGQNPEVVLSRSEARERCRLIAS